MVFGGDLKHSREGVVVITVNHMTDLLGNLLRGKWRVGISVQVNIKGDEFQQR